MATPIKQTEKDFLLKVLYDEQLPVIYLRDRGEYTLTLNRPAGDELVFRSDRPITNLKAGNKPDLLFDYRGKMILFSGEITLITDNLVFCKTPDLLYKNLDRSYTRVMAPPEMDAQFIFQGDRYNLSFPRVTEYEPGIPGIVPPEIDPRDFSELIGQMSGWIQHYASGYKLVIFKDAAPSGAEELIIAETGKILYLPSTQGDFPHTDPYPRKRIITGEMFRRYLESTGIDLTDVDNACARFLKAKYQNGIRSEAWLPVLFHEYVIGYIQAWINAEGKPPFDYSVIDTLYQFTQILAFSLKANGYFERGKLHNEPFGGTVIDISASGLLFAYPDPGLLSPLLPGSELTVKISTPRRTINVATKIARRYTDNTMSYFGCAFINMAPEDLRFLFECIYGRPFTDADAMFFRGQV
jgi:hypothetical protein